MDGPGDQRPLELRGPVAAPPRRRAPLLVVVLVLVASVLGVAWAAGGDDAVDVTIDGTTTTTAPGERRQVPDPGSFPAPIALGGPTDGTESVGLPVKAEPGTDLADGQTLTVTGTGFPPGVSVGVVMCAREAGRDHGARGASACDLGRFAQTESDADGVATAQFTARRLVVLDGEEIDCASEPGRCLIGMGMISDYDTSGGVLVDFDPSEPLPDPPTVEVDRTEGLVDGDRLVVDLTGLVPGTSVGASLCNAVQSGCAELSSDPVVTREDGTATLEVVAWRAFGVPMWDAHAPTNVDCVLEPCALALWGESARGRAIPSVPLHFEVRPLDRSPIEAELTSDGPFAPGDELEVLVRSVPSDLHVELVLCGSEHCGAWETRVDREGDDLRATTRIVSGAEGNPCAGETCSLRVHVFGQPSGPPLLLPDPIPIRLAT